MEECLGSQGRDQRRGFPWLFRPPLLHDKLAAVLGGSVFRVEGRRKAEGFSGGTQWGQTGLTLEQLDKAWPRRFPI